MKSSRAGKQTRAYWRMQEKRRKAWLAETPVTETANACGQHFLTEERLQGHAAGWIDGVNWLRRQQAAAANGANKGASFRKVR